MLDVAVKNPAVADVNDEFFEGHIDTVSGSLLIGWAISISRPDDEVSIIVMCGNSVIGKGEANRFRKDLCDRKTGTGKHGFEIRIDTSNLDGSARAITLVDELTGSLVSTNVYNLKSNCRLNAESQLLSVDIEDRRKNSESKSLVFDDSTSITFDIEKNGPYEESQGQKKLACEAIGFVDLVTDTHISGWAWIPTATDKSVEVSLEIGGDVYKKIRANEFRQDLLEAEKGTGKYGFSIRLNNPINWSVSKLKIEKYSGKIQGGSTDELANKIKIFRASQKAKRRLTYYPDYSSTNPYQSKLAASLPKNWESSPGDIDEAISRIRGSITEEKHIFHLHWVNPVISNAPNEWEAERQKDHFIAKLREYIVLGGTLIWTIHNVLSHDRKYEEIERELCQEVAELATKVHVHSSIVLSEIEKDYAVRPGKLVVLEHPEYIGVYPNYISTHDARRQLNIPQEAVVFAFVGQLRPYKGLNELIEAFRELQRSYDNVHLLIAGKPIHPFGPENIRQLTTGIDECTLVTEFVPDNQLQVYFNASDFVVLPYKNVLTSGSVINALSFSRPVIAPCLGVLPETIVDGENGWLYEPNDKNALLNTMSSCIDTGVLEKKELLFKNCKKSIDHLTWDVFGQSLSAEVELRLEPEWIDIEVGKNTRRIQVVQSKHDRTKRRDVAIVILNYEHYDDVKRLVESIDAGTCKDIEYFIVDNDSHNLSFSEFVSFAPMSGAPTTHIRVDHNGGYALGNNVGITQALKQDFEFVWVVNPDIVMEEGALDTLSNSAIEYPECSLFGSTIYSGGTNGKIWSAGGRLNFDNGLDASHLYGGMEKSVLPEKAYSVDYITGASLFCRAIIFDKVGLIPEDYFLYFEETDWCLRLRATGETILVEPHAELSHFKQSESGSLPSSYYFYYYIRNALIFTMRNKPVAYEKTLVALRNNFISPWLEKIEKRNPDKLEQYNNIVSTALRDASVRKKGFQDLNKIMFPSDTEAPSSRAVGHLEYVDHNMVTGWAYDPENSKVYSDLAVFVDEQLVGNVTAHAQLRRSDLQDAGLGDGYCGFRFQFPKPITDLERHTVKVAFVNGGSIGKKVFVTTAHKNYKGRIDGVAGYEIRGWAYNSGNVVEAPIVELNIDDNLVVVGRADSYRADLQSAGIGSGYHGFEIRLPASKLDGQEHKIELRLPGSETVLATRVVVAKPAVENLPNTGLQKQLTWISKHREFAIEKAVESQLESFFKQTESALVSVGERQNHTAMVSVVMPAFNREKTIETSIKSVLEQSYCNFELIIIDDGSSDRTVEVVKRLVANQDEPRIKLISLAKNIGVSAARNVGLKHASGEFVAYLDSDNTWRKNFLIVMITSLVLSPDVESAYCGQTVLQVLQTPEGSIDDPVMVRAGPFSLALIENRNYIDLNCFIHKKSIFEKLGGFNENIRRLVDWELIWRYGYVKSPKFIPALLSDYFMAKAENQITRLESYESNFNSIQKVFSDSRKRLDKHIFVDDGNANPLNLIMILDKNDHSYMDSSISDALLAIRDTRSHLTILAPEGEWSRDSKNILSTENSQLTIKMYCEINAESYLEDVISDTAYDCVLLSGNASIQSNTLRHLSHAAEISDNAGIIVSKKLKKMRGNELNGLSTYASSAMKFDQVETHINSQIESKQRLNHIIEASTDELFCALIPRQALLKISLEGSDLANRDQVFQFVTAQLSCLHELRCYQAGRALAYDLR